MRFILTGGAGFIGSHLTNALLTQGHEVTVLDNLSTGRIENLETFMHNARFRFIRSDVTDASLLESQVALSDVVFHLAACVGVQNVVDDPIYCIENNLNGTSLVLRFAAEYDKRVMTFSTSEVYGKANKFPFGEDDDVVLGPAHRLRWSYAASKLVDDYLARAYFEKHRTRVTTVRLFNTIGQGQLGHYGMVVPRFFKQAMAGAPITVYGDGAQTRCFTDVRDVVRALILLVENPHCHGELINIGCPKEISIYNLAERIRDLVGSSSPIMLVSYAEAYGQNFEDMNRRVPNTLKLRQLTGFEFQYDLQQTLDWIREGLSESVVRLTPARSFERVVAT